MKRERDRDTQRETQREGDRETDSERQRHRETETERDEETETDRDRERRVVYEDRKTCRWRDGGMKREGVGWRKVGAGVRETDF